MRLMTTFCKRIVTWAAGTRTASYRVCISGYGSVPCLPLKQCCFFLMRAIVFSCKCIALHYPLQTLSTRSTKSRPLLSISASPRFVLSQLGSRAQLFGSRGRMWRMIHQSRCGHAVANVCPHHFCNTFCDTVSTLLLTIRAPTGDPMVSILS